MFGFDRFIVTKVLEVWPQDAVDRKILLLLRFRRKVRERKLCKVSIGSSCFLFTWKSIIAYCKKYGILKRNIYCIHEGNSSYIHERYNDENKLQNNWIENPSPEIQLISIRFEFLFYRLFVVFSRIKAKQTFSSLILMN